MIDKRFGGVSVPTRRLLNVSQQILVWCAVIGGLYLSSLYSYILFHSIVEIFSIIVSACIFLIAWNSRRFLGNNYMLFLGLSFLFITIIDGLHTMSYKGMGVFQGYDSNLPTQLWIIMRYMLAISFLIAPVFIIRKVNVPLVLSVYSVATILLLLSVFYWGIFPACYVEGTGLTPFKIYSEYIISLILVGSLIFLLVERKTFDRYVLGLLAGATVLSILAEISFTTYASVYGFSNMLGHMFIFVSFYLIYKALIETDLTKPYVLMFRDLKLSEDKYRKLFENMSSAFALHEIITDNSGKPVDYAFLAVNSLFEKMTGLRQKDILGRRVTQVLPGTETDPADWIGNYGKVALGGEPIAFEQYSETLGKWYSIAAYSPAERQFATVFVDVTERKRAEEALIESEEKYRMVVENALESIYIAVDGMLKFGNNRAAVITGYSQDELTSRPFIEFIHPDDRVMVIDRHRRRIKGEDIPNIYSFRIIDKSGNIKWVELSAVFINWEGRPATLNFLTDITDRKRREEEQQLVEKMESVGLLAGGIAHDFNNILTAILGNISLARIEAAPGSNLQNSLEQAEKASLRAKDLTVQLLTFSRGGAPITKLASLVELLKDTTVFALRGSKVKCHFSIPTDLWHAEIDKGQVSQVIHNLVINAQQAMPTGGTIEITAENMAISETQSLGRGLPLKAGDYLRIAVTDHGIGVPANQLEKIFDPFFTTKQTGSGLGLATSFSIARQHGGHLSVESEVGSGSTFYLYLPASTETAALKQHKKETSKPICKARILVMDDDQGIRDIAGRMFKHIGYNDVEFAEDGAEAFKLYKAAMESGNPFSAVILDLTIAGGMGGEWTIRKLIKIDPGVKAIVSSGYMDDAVIAKYREYGFSGIVAKPYTIEELRKAVQDVIGGA